MVISYLSSTIKNNDVDEDDDDGDDDDSDEDVSMTSHDGDAFIQSHHSSIFSVPDVI